MWQTQGQTRSVFWSLSPQLCQCLGSRPGCYGNSKALRKPWLPFPRGRCPPFLAGPLPIALTCPFPACFTQIASLRHLSPLAPSPLRAITISFLSPMVLLSLSLLGFISFCLLNTYIWLMSCSSHSP